MDIELAIEQVKNIIFFLESVQYEHEQEEDGDVPEDVEVYDDGSYNNLVDAAETLVSALDLLVELKRSKP